MDDPQHRPSTTAVDGHGRPRGQNSPGSVKDSASDFGSDGRGSIPLRGTTSGIEERFWARVDKNGPLPSNDPTLGVCWVWTGARTTDGYGELSVNQRPAYTHRISYEIANGPIPAGKLIRHRCNFPPCANPAHLLLGGKSENALDAVAAGAMRIGQDHRGAKLTDADVLSIRSRAAVMGRGRFIALAREYAISDSAIRSVYWGKTWKHLPPPPLPTPHASFAIDTTTGAVSSIGGAP